MWRGVTFDATTVLCRGWVDCVSERWVGSTDGSMDGWMDGMMDGWIRVDTFVHGCMDGWTGCSSNVVRMIDCDYSVNLLWHGMLWHGSLV